MKKVLLILTKDNYPSPDMLINIVPQGLPYIAGALEANGYKVFGINPNYVQFSDNVKESLYKLISQKIQECECDYIGLGGLSADYLFIRDAIAVIREINPAMPIILGGGIISSDTEYIFEKLKPDIGVLLEGEITIVKLLNSLENTQNLADVEGIVYQDNGKTVLTKAQSQSVSLDTLAYPNYDIFDLEKFYELSTHDNMYFMAYTQKNPRMITISGGRSCPFKCTFCYHSTGAKYQNRKIEDIINEIIFFYEKYKFNMVAFYDELFSVNESRLLELCDAIIKLKKEHRIEFDWTCSMRVKPLKKEIVVRMKEAGCIFIGFGFESASDVVLKSMKKKIKKVEIINAMELCEEIGIGIQANFIFGDPADTYESLKETREFFLERCRNHIVHVGIIAPYPGAPIWDYCIDNKIITDKQDYYENIYKGNSYNNFINMTEIDKTTFFDVVNDIVEVNYHYYKSLIIDRVENSEHYDVFGKCPHCKADIDYRFSKINFGTNLYTKINSVIPRVHFCPNCNKRVIISTIEPFSDFKHQLQKYFKDVDGVMQSAKNVVVVLANNFYRIDTYSLSLKILQYYGFAFDELNIDYIGVFENHYNTKEFAGSKIKTLSTDSVNSSNEIKYIVMPHNDQDVTIEKLKVLNVEEKNILFLSK